MRRWTFEGAKPRAARLRHESMELTFVNLSPTPTVSHHPTSMQKLLPALALLVPIGCSAPEATPPNGPAITQDVVYGHKSGMALTMDVYTPEAPNGAGILFLNSGSGVSPFCTFHTQDAASPRLLILEELKRCEEFRPHGLLDAGFTVFNVRQGSSPRFNVGEATEDARRAVKSLQEKAARFGVDAANLGVWGGSAGGQLALMLGLAPRTGDSEEARFDMPLRAVAVYYAPHSVELEEPEMVALVPALDMPVEVLRAVSPIYHVSDDDPPPLFIHRDQDAVVPLASGQATHSVRLEAGVETEIIIVEGAGHGFTGPDADAALAATLAWFERHLGG